MRCLALLLLVAFAAQANAKIFPDDMQDKLQHCLEEHNLLSGMMQEVRANGVKGFLENPGKTMKCCSKCILTGAQFLTAEGKWNMEKLQPMLDGASVVMTLALGDKADAWKAGAEGCLKEERTADDQCSDIWETKQCLKRNDIKLVKKILDGIGGMKEIIRYVMDFWENA